MNKKRARISLPVIFIVLIVLSLLSAAVLSYPLYRFYRNTETDCRTAEYRMLESSLAVNSRMNEEVLENRDRNLKAMMQFLLHVQQKNEWTAEELKNHANSLGIGSFELVYSQQSADQYAASAQMQEDRKIYCAKPDADHILILRDDLTFETGLQENLTQVLSACTAAVSEESPIFLDAYIVDRKNRTVITPEGVTPLEQTDRVIPDTEEKYEYDGRIYGLSSVNDGMTVMHYHDETADTDLYTVYSEFDSAKMARSVNRFVTIIFLCTLMSFALYTFFVRQFKSQHPDDEEYSNKTIRWRTVASIIFTVVINLIAAVYAQCFYSVAAFSMYDRNMISEADRIISAVNENTRILHDHCRDEYLKTAAIISDYLSSDQQRQETVELNEIRNIFGFDYVVLYDHYGSERISDGSVWSLSFSSDPDDPAFAMNELRFGISGVFVDPYYNSYTGRRNARAAVPLKNSDPSLSGFLEVGISTSKTDMVFVPESIYGEITASVPEKTGAIFFIDKDTKIITGSTLRKYENLPAEAAGFSEEFLTPGYFNTLKINDRNSYVSTGQVPGKIMSIVLIASVLSNMDLMYVAGVTGLSLLACMVLLFAMHLQKKKTQIYDIGMFGIFDSRRARDKGSSIIRPEDRIGRLFRILLTAVIISMILNFEGQMLFRKENPLFTEIMQSGWNKGLNIFALTSSIILIAWSYIFVFAIRRILKQIGQMGTLHVETVTRLLRSAIRYIAVVFVIYKIMLNFGLNPEALATSAGLIGIAIGIGARDLITDILAGLFIIFERDYEVGDIVTVDRFTGRVHEIGMRVTKLINSSGSEKIINNRNMVNIVKVSYLPETIIIRFRVPYDTSAASLNALIMKESAALKEKYPDLLTAPQFTGIIEFEEDMILCGIYATCPKEKNSGLTSSLSNELKRIMDENGIPMQIEDQK